MTTVIPKKKGHPVVDKLQNIKAVVRVRPLSRAEEELHVKTIVKCVSQREIMTKEKKFHFDRVFKPETEQIDVYRAVVAPMIPDIIAGYNCTIFAYGPTGSGKTYTMTGATCQSVENWRADPYAGCIPRAAAHIFEELQALEKNESNVKVSYLELYNEEIRDLLSDDDAVLPIFNDTKGSVFIQGLTEVTVHDCDGLCKQLQKGIIKRQTAPTLMNHQSSRSHTVFTITVHSRETTISGEDILKSGKINLVDLAGSENIARSGCKDMRAVELANINKSLLTLGRVIQALADKAPKHVPYRDSKLTRILQDSLGGHTKTAIIATISPAANSYDETISTLDYASRARDIKNTPTVNEKLTKAQMIQGLINEIDRLQRDLDAARDKSGFFVNKENYERLIETVELVTGEKLTMEELTRKQSSRIKELEEIVDTKLREFDDTVNECKKNKELLHVAKALIKEKKESLKQEQYVSKAYEAQAGQLHQEVKELISTTEILSEERGILQDKLEKQYHINIANESTARSAVNQVLDMLKKISEEEEKLTISDTNLSELCRQDINDLKVAVEASLEHLKQVLDDFTQSNIHDFVLKENIKSTMNVCISTIKEKVTDLKEQLEKDAELLKKFETVDIPVFINQFQDIMKAFILDIRNITAKMNEVLNQDHLEIIKHVEKLETEILTRKEEEEIIYKKRQERDNELLGQIKGLKNLVAKQRTARADRFLHDITCKEEQTKSIVNKMVKTFNEINPERVNSLPSATKPEEITKVAVEMEKEILENLTEIEDDQREKNSQSLDKLNESVTENFSNIAGVLQTKVNIVNSRLEFLMDDRESFQRYFDSFAKKANEILTDGFLQKVVPVKHEGDTPMRKSIVVHKPLDPHPREVLIERFKQERALMDDEDKENIPGELNTSTLSLTNARISESDLELGDSSESCQ